MAPRGGRRAHPDVRSPASGDLPEREALRGWARGSTAGDRPARGLELSWLGRGLGNGGQTHAEALVPDLVRRVPVVPVRRSRVPRLVPVAATTDDAPSAAGSPSPDDGAERDPLAPSTVMTLSDPKKFQLPGARREECRRPAIRGKICRFVAGTARFCRLPAESCGPTGLAGRIRPSVDRWAGQSRQKTVASRHPKVMERAEERRQR